MKTMYPFHLHPIYLSHASPVVERDLESVIFDTDWSFRTWDFAGDFDAGDGVHWAGRHIELVTATELDWSTPTTSLKCKFLYVFFWFSKKVIEPMMFDEVEHII